MPTSNHRHPWLGFMLIAPTLFAVACRDLNQVEYEGTADLKSPPAFHLPLANGAHEASFGLIRQGEENFRFYLRISSPRGSTMLSSLREYNRRDLEAAKNDPWRLLRIPLAIPCQAGRKRPPRLPALVIELGSEDRPRSLTPQEPKLPDTIGFNIYSARHGQDRLILGRKIGQFYGSFAGLNHLRG